MAQHQNQRHTQNLNRILDAAKRHAVYSVAGIANDKQLTQSRVEQQLWCHATIGATDQDSKRHLTPCNFQSAIFIAGGFLRELIPQKVIVSLFKPFKRLRWAKFGLFTLCRIGRQKTQTARQTQGTIAQAKK